MPKTTPKTKSLKTKTPKKPATKKAAAKTKAAPRKTAKALTPKREPPKRVNKSALIRSFPATTPVSEVVATMKKRGVEVSPNVVYAVRSISRRPKTPKSPNGHTPKIARASTSSGLVVEIERIVEAKLREMLSGKLSDLIA